MSIENPYLPLDQKMVGDIYTSLEVMENLTILCDDLGSRFGGTPSEKKASEFILSTFEKYGLQKVHAEPYSYPGWTRGKATLRILEPVEREIACISLPYCQAAEIKASLVNGGCGTKEELEKNKDALAGSLVLVSALTPAKYGRWIHRKEKYSRSAAHKAAGFIYVSETPGLGPETGSLQSGRPAPIPGISISYEDGKFLERLLQRHGKVTLHLTTTDTGKMTESWNIVGEIPGEKPEELVVLCCHYDGHDIAQGAIDPASGLVVLMETARVLSKYASSALKSTIRFIAWGTEEIGLVGSHRYAEKHEGELDHFRFVLNLDSAGDEYTKGVILHQWPNLAPLFQQMGKDMKFPMEVGQKMNAYSDHFPFALRGVPTGELGDPLEKPQGRGFTHSCYDTLDKVKLSNLWEASALASRIALRIAGLPSFPAKRKTAQEMEVILKTDPNLEGYRVQKELEKNLAL